MQGAIGGFSNEPSALVWLKVRGSQLRHSATIYRTVILKMVAKHIDCSRDCHDKLSNSD